MGRRGGGREKERGRGSAQKTPRVSSQRDENILNATGGKLPGVKLSSGGRCREMHRKEGRLQSDDVLALD